MKKMMVGFLCSLVSFLMLTACGGGGGGSSTPPPVAKSSLSTVSGSAVISLSALVSKSAAKLDGASIEISSFDKNDKELGRAAVTTDNAGGFAAQVPMLDTGGYIMVTATKEGFSQFQKRVDYTSPGTIELKAILQGLNVTFANISSGGALAAGVGKSSEPSFSFAVVKFPNGVKKALAGKSIRAAKAAGGSSELEINIPASSLPGVKKLKGELETFDPATASDRFPGSYTGIVGGKEGKMVSLAFDYMKISNADTGENLGEVAKKLVKSGVRKAADSATTVTRSIYSSSCENLFIEDYNKTAPGHQVPVWSLNPSTGKWIFIGEGTIVDSNGDVIATPVLGDNASGCKSGVYRLKIMVSNSEFAKSWWNLDHIVFDTPTEVCLKGKFSYSNGDPLKNLYLSLSGSNIDYKWGMTDSTTGEFTLSTVLLNKNSTDRTGRLTYLDENGNYTGVDVTLAAPPTCGAYTKSDFTKPCEVSGKLVDDAGTGVPYRWLNFQGNNFYRGVNSDSTGAFTSLVACNTDISLYMGGSNKVGAFNVNGTTSGNTDEITDDAVKVALKDLVVPNIPPSGYVNLSQRSIKNSGTITADISAYDEDGNYPVNYVLKISGNSAASGSINGTTTFSATHAITGLAVGEHTVSLELTDSKGAKRIINAGSISVSDGSRPPVVTAYASQLYVNSCGSNNTITLNGSAYDPDGDSLTALWSGTGVTCTGNSSANGFITSSCDVTVTGNTTYTYTVTDNSTPTPKSASRDVLVSTYSSSPWVSSLTASPSLVPEGATGTARDITVTAVANHSDGISLSGIWLLNNNPISSCPDVTSFSSGASQTCTYSIPSTATAGDKFTFSFTATGCGKTGSRATTVTYGNLADVNIVVQ
ncbi:MAG: hypothetical protein PHI31_00085 [Desulfuromonadaceae bacterium]|nr:hypothetical protein [Desulfuromonadaceae bacterium]